jgi:GLPGLI family protein
MKKIILSFLVLVVVKLNAQQFINSGKIEYEVRVNNHRMFGDGLFAQSFKNSMPNFSTYYYDLTFTENKGLYQFNRLNEKDKMPGNNFYIGDNVWFSDYSTKTFTNQKFVFDGTYIISDSLMNINWKMVPNETREIAGFTCRKAQGIIFDSVYVFAFYTDEITTNGGPMSISGLPGMILGITIPRMFTSWIATKVEVNGVKANIVTAPTKGKKKNAMELKTDLEKVSKNWGNWGQQQIWNIFL